MQSMKHANSKKHSKMHIKKHSAIGIKKSHAAWVLCVADLLVRCASPCFASILTPPIHLVTDGLLLLFS
jgi:hypothetical protein